MAQLGLIFILCFIWLSQGFTKPFIGHHDWNGVFYSNIAQNYLKFGLLGTKLGQMTQPGSFYTHYPPLLTLILAGFFKVFGVNDVVARLVPLIFYSAAIVLLVAICRSRKVLILLFVPMLRYFAKMPSQEALIVFFSCLSVYAHLNQKSKLFYFSVIGNGLSGWAGYFLYPFLLLKDRFKLIKTGLILIGIFSLHLFHLYWLTGSFLGGGILDAFLLRLGLFPRLGRIEPELSGQFSWLNYLFKQIRILTVYYTATLISLSGFNFILIIRKIIQKIKLSQLESIVLVFLAWGLSYPLIFPNLVFVHEYFNVFLAPFFGLSFVNLVDRFKLKSILIILIFLAIFWERNSFYQALAKTKAFLPGYLYGLLIKNNTLPGQTYQLRQSAEFIESQQLFINFYSQRQIEYIKTDDSQN